MSAMIEMAVGILFGTEVHPQNRPNQYTNYIVFVNLLFDFRQEKF